MKNISKLILSIFILCIVINTTRSFEIFGLQVESEEVEKDLQAEVNSVVSELFTKVLKKEGKSTKIIIFKLTII